MSCAVHITTIAAAFAIAPADAQTSNRQILDQIAAALPPPSRQRLNLDLVAAGYTNAVATAALGAKFMDGLRTFQSDNNLPSTGLPDPATLQRLRTVADENFAQWGFRKVSHPSRGIELWIPLGLGLNASRNIDGLHWEDPRGRLKLDFTSVAGISIESNFRTLLGLLTDRGATIHYQVLKDGWFVVSFGLPDGVDGYMRYHQDGSNVTGFTLYWKNSAGVVHGERIAILMSGALWSQFNGRDYPPPPLIPARAAVPPQDVPPQPSPAPGAVSAPAPAARSSLSSGTGFFIARDGALVTNAHVVEGCSEIVAKDGTGVVASASVLARDAANDLVLLRREKPAPKILPVRIGARLGENIAVFGFPHSNLLSSSGNFTLGNITALSGLSDDSRNMQISAPVQSGNSGGPVLDYSGNVVGVVVSKLNALKIAARDGDLPQNVNFAIKAATLVSFLETNRIVPEYGVLSEKPMTAPDLADRARDASAFILCSKTER